MGKIILEFNSLEEAQDAQTAIDGWKWKHVVWELDQQLRGTTKYGSSVISEGSESASSVERDVADRYREIIRELMSSNGVSFE